MAVPLTGRLRGTEAAFSTIAWLRNTRGSLSPHEGPRARWEPSDQERGERDPLNQTLDSKAAKLTAPGSGPWSI